MSRVRAIAAIVVAVATAAVGFDAVGEPRPAYAAVTEIVGAPVGATQLSLGNSSRQATIFETTSPDYAAFPQLWAFDTVVNGNPVRRIGAEIGLSPDSLSAQPRFGVTTSLDGWNFTGFTAEARNTRNPVRLRDGRLMSIGFMPVLPTGRCPSTTAAVPLERHISNDDGATWVRQPDATLTSSQPWGVGFDRCLRTNPRILADPDGTLYMTIYTRFAADEGVIAHRVELVVSTDDGASWQWRSTIFRPTTAQYAANEAAIVRDVDGRIFAVTRTDTTNGGSPATAGVLLWTRSYDNGNTWTTGAPGTTAAPLPLLVSFTGGSTRSLYGVDPDLTLMPNGVMVLTSGRPDAWIAISADGRGDSWQQGQVYYRNRQTGGTNNQWHHGSSGYGAIVAIEPNFGVAITDNCAANWGCPAGGTFEVGPQQRVIRRMVDVLTPGDGKIDLDGKVRAGRVQVTTNMTATDPAHNRLGAGGAIDGSTEYWSSAASAGGDGTYTLTLDRTYLLNRIGLSVRTGQGQRAQVQVSTDNTTWTTVHDTSVRADHALRYVALSTPVAAKYVRVLTTATDGCQAASLGATCAMLNELELYSDIDSFENDGVWSVPRGFTATDGAYISQAGVDDSSRVLRIHDLYTDRPVYAKRISGPSSTKTVEFRFHADQIDNAFLFNIRGLNSAGGEVAAFHFYINKDGQIGRYNGSAWSQLAPNGTVNHTTWTTLRVVAASPTGQATVYVNGVAVGTSPAIAGAVTLTGAQFGSAGTVPAGMKFVIDDVRITA